MPEPNALLDRLEPGQIVDALAAYARGGSARQVAQSLGVSKTGVLELLQRLGVQPRVRRGLSEPEVAAAVRLYESGLLLREIGQRFGVSRDCVRLALKKRGVVMRPGLGARQAKSKRRP